MATQRERLAAYRELAQGQGASEIRMALGDAEATQLASELLAAGEPIPYAAEVAATVSRLAGAASAPVPTDTVALLAHVGELQKAVTAFWDVFEGQVIDGIVVIRRRA